LHFVNVVCCPCPDVSSYTAALGVGRVLGERAQESTGQDSGVNFSEQRGWKFSEGLQQEAQGRRCAYCCAAGTRELFWFPIQLFEYLIASTLQRVWVRQH